MSILVSCIHHHHVNVHTHTSTVPLGHILTKFELQVLSGLLDAYSNEKIKEIQQFIRKKRGRDISREEIERSLREGGLTTVADELEQDLLKGKHIIVSGFKKRAHFAQKRKF